MTVIIILTLPNIMIIFIGVYYSVNNVMAEQVLPPLRSKLYGGAWSIHDNESIDFLKNIQNKPGNKKKFIQEYKEWMSSDNEFYGLKKYKQIDFSAGTTESFNMFYFRHLEKRLRIYKGEYFYHHLMARNYFRKFEFLENSPIQYNDVVVMSCPFSNTGNLPENFYGILQQCDKLKVPVLLDLAYINVSNIKHLDLSYKCIQTITTSLSKVFPVEHYRIGIRLERELYDDTLVAYNQNDYVNLYSINIGHELIRKFHNKWLYTKYQDKQADECKKLGLDISECVIFGLDKNEKYPEYKRGTKINRLCFSRKWDKRVYA